MVDYQNYLDIMIDSLKKKNRVLDSVILMNDEQAKLFTDNDMSDDAFDEGFEDAMRKKQKLIDELDMLNSGFEELYDRVREPLTQKRSEYAESIKKMQELIKEIFDKSAKVEVQEKANSELAKKKFQGMHNRIKKSRMSRNVASHYYKNISNLNIVDSQFLDKTK